MISGPSLLALLHADHAMEWSDSASYGRERQSRFSQLDLGDTWFAQESRKGSEGSPPKSLCVVHVS